MGTFSTFSDLTVQNGMTIWQVTPCFVVWDTVASHLCQPTSAISVFTLVA